MRGPGSGSGASNLQPRALRMEILNAASGQHVPPGSRPRQLCSAQVRRGVVAAPGRTGPAAMAKHLFATAPLAKVGCGWHCHAWALLYAQWFACTCTCPAAAQQHFPSWVHRRCGACAWPASLQALFPGPNRPGETLLRMAAFGSMLRCVLSTPHLWPLPEIAASGMMEAVSSLTNLLSFRLFGSAFKTVCNTIPENPHSA